jgi:hypothetical protein
MIAAAAPSNEPGAQIQLPSRNARATGLIIAVITAFLAILMITDGAGNGGGEGIVRVVAGVLLVGLSVVVGALSLFPAQIARAVRRRSRREA